MRKDWIIARERAANVLRHFDEGMDISDIAKLYGLTYMRVHQIVTKARGKMRQQPKDASAG